MKNESLHIKNLGPVAEALLPSIKRVNVFIGASGSGKSTIMKVLAMCRWVYKMQCIRSYLKQSGIGATKFKLRAEYLLKNSGLLSFVNSETEILYENGSYRLEVRGNKFVEVRGLVPRNELSLEKVAYISDKRGLLADLSAGNVSIRHGLYYLNETFRNFQSAVDAISSTTLDYLGVRMDVRRTQAGRRIYVTPTAGAADGRNFAIPLSVSSSGIQNSVGLHFILTYFDEHYNLVQSMNSTILRYLADSDSLSAFKADTNVGAFPYKRISLFVEEPELSLFPANQKGLVDFFVKLINRRADAEINLTFATHSPYILTALNLHLLAARAAAVNHASAGACMGDDAEPLAYDDISAWEVKDGCVRTLLDPELQIIDGTWLDSVSDVFDDRIACLNDIIYG